MLKKLIVAAILILAIASVSSAQEREMSPEEMQVMIEQQMASMTPFFGQMMKIMMDTTFDVLADPATAEKLASFTRNYYEALVKKGFSKAKAMQIATAVGMPTMPMMQQ